MRYFSLNLVMIMMIVSACNTATPEPEPIGTATASPTQTVSADEMTQALNFQSTLPASFTPTTAPSNTPTPVATNTLTMTPTTTPIPEDILCEVFISSSAPNGATIPVDDLDDYVQFFIPYDNVRILLTITNLDTGEIAERAILDGDMVWDAVFTPEFYPDIAEYEWLARLEDRTRTGLCERRGTFDTRAEELIVAESTTEITPEITAEVTLEVSAEATAELELEITPETTAEATRNPAPFPPR